VAALVGGLAAWEAAGYPVVAEETSLAFSAETVTVLGNPQAPVTMVEFSDFECPFCRRYVQQTQPQIFEKYVDSGQVRYMFKDFPLSSIHPQAQKAAEAAECAGAQGQYWAMHDRLFEGQDEWNLANDPIAAFEGYAAELGLEAGQFSACLASGQFAAEVQADAAEGTAAGVEGTPTFFINGQKVIGAQPFGEFERIIEGELSQQAP
jgi:protein-disulfide isomerase